MQSLNDVIIKENFIVLTGGPGGGKSSVIDVLRQRGFESVDETARLIIKKRLAAGMSPRPSPIDFATEMFELDLDQFRSRIDSSKITFFDRSFLDSAALMYDADLRKYERIAHLLNTNRFNSNIFITPPWEEIYTGDDERDQTFQEAVTTYQKLFDWYRSMGYTLKILPKTSVNARVDFILNEIKLF